MMKKALSLPAVSLALALAVSGSATADMELTTPDGLRVLLRDDYTWEYLPPAEEGGEPQAQEQADAVPEIEVVPAVLSVERVRQYADACQFWLKLENRLPYPIRNIALRFSAYIKDPNYPDPVLYEADTRSFSEVRPTGHQFRDLFFMNTACDRIAHIKVEDTGRCSMGELTKFSAQTGDCTRHIDVKETELVKIFK